MDGCDLMMNIGSSNCLSFRVSWLVFLVTSDTDLSTQLYGCDWFSAPLFTVIMLTKASQICWPEPSYREMDLPYKRIITMAIFYSYPLQLPLLSAPSHPLVYHLYFIPLVDCLSSQSSLKLSYFCYRFPPTISFPSVRHLSW